VEDDGKCITCPDGSSLVKDTCYRNCKTGQTTSGKECVVSWVPYRKVRERAPATAAAECLGCVQSTGQRRLGQAWLRSGDWPGCWLARVRRLVCRGRSTTTA
jgi:hypothetical protein